MTASRLRAVLLGSLMVFCDPALADSITFVGSPIALRNCRVQSIQGGQVVFLDASNKRQQRSIDDVNSLSFEGLVTLDEAEKLIAAGDLENGLRGLMLAAIANGGDMQRLWIHARLARIHDARGQYVEAAGHAATVMAMTDDPYWRKLEPVTEPRATSFAAATESLLALQDAAREVQSTALKASVDRMIKIVRPLRDQLAATYAGPAITPGSTISGISRAELASPGSTSKSPSASQPASGSRDKNAKPPPPPQPMDAQQGHAPSPPVDLEPIKRQPAPLNELNSESRIELLLEQKQFAEALTQCEKVEANPGDRDLAKFLWQYGRALMGSGKAGSAAVMFTRCGLLYPASPNAAPCLIEAASIARDVWMDSAAAGRLLQRALETAQRNEQAAIADEARKALQSLADTSAHKEP